MLKVTRSTTLTGQISVNNVGENEAREIPILYLSASVNENGDQPTITKTIQNKEAYIFNKESINEDVHQFENMVEDLIR